jgi:hypothetical protein
MDFRDGLDGVEKRDISGSAGNRTPIQRSSSKYPTRYTYNVK